MAAAVLMSTVVLGCGADDSEPSGGDTTSAEPSPSPSASASVSASEWAEQTCSDIAAWHHQLQQAAKELRAQETPDAETIRTAVREVAAATSALVDDVTALPPPATEAGDRIRQEIAALREQLAEQAAAIEAAVAAGADTPQQLMAATAKVAQALSAMAADVGAAADRLRDADPSGELEDAFKQSPACDDLTGRR